MRFFYFIVFLLFIGSTTAEDNNYFVKFTVNLGHKRKDSFVVEINSGWAPLGAGRMKELVQENFFSGCRFFRVVSGFMAQFGINGKPDVALKWKSKTLSDDPVVKSNKRGKYINTVQDCNYLIH